MKTVLGGIGTERGDAWRGEAYMRSERQPMEAVLEVERCSRWRQYLASRIREVEVGIMEESEQWARGLH